LDEARSERVPGSSRRGLSFFRDSAMLQNDTILMADKGFFRLGMR
jgi:hypothetical protein